jgi:hypothetical protein
MDSTVKSRPNHYAVLGIKPTATAEEVAQAFIRQMFSPRPMVQVAQIGAAYEVLRNPAKRRAYDASLGFTEEPQGILAKPVVAFSTRARYVAALPAITFDPPAIDRPAAAAAQPVAPEAWPEPAPAPQPALEASLAADYRSPTKEPRDSAFDWRRPAIITVVLVAAVGLVGAWAGSLAGNDVEAQQVTLALPKPKPAAKLEAAAPAVPDTVAAALEQQSAAVAPRIERRPAAQPRPQDRLAEVSQSLHHSYYATTGTDGMTEIAATEAPVVPATTPAPTVEAAAASAASAATASNMPLSNTTIAHTLHKIGYPCGAVASTEAVDGQAGAFNVTCTSGQTYRASPVKGRYRFKRM